MASSIWAASGGVGPKRAASSYSRCWSISASRMRARKASVPSPGSGVSADTTIALRTSLSGIAVSLTVAAMRSTISAWAPAARAITHTPSARRDRRIRESYVRPRAIFPIPMTDPRPGQLLVVGTPIGNLDDFSPRGQRALAEATAIFCEDTRVTAKLAARFGLTARRISCPGPREESRVAELLERLRAGETVAIVTDAGMPTLSDPGVRLVEAAVTAGFPVRVVPGPSAPAAALAVSGLPPVPHVFLGFLPARKGERSRFLESLRERPETLIWFEAPHRVAESLDDAARVLGGRRACVARELTKLHEETRHGTLPDLAREFRARESIRGEITVVVEGLRAGADTRRESHTGADAGELDRRIREALAAGSAVKALSREIARRTGLPAREIYARALALSGRGADGKKKA